MPPVLKSRRFVQWAMTLVVIAMGVQFTLWLRPHMAGEWPVVPRPAGVEAFLPINSMMAFRHLLGTGRIDAIHPAGLAIFLAVCLMSLTLARSFCSHLCPVGLLSELCGRLGLRALGRNLRLPRWLDIPLRGLKWFLLGFFTWAVWWTMSPGSIKAFLDSPYARVMDARMWLFFAEPSRLTLWVLAILVVASLFIRDFWCRYLCPYGALLGALGRLAFLKVRRRASICISCRKCSDVCPARLPVHELETVSSVECTSCQDCVATCGVPSCLTVGRVRPRFGLQPAAAVILAALVFLSVIAGFRLAGHWHSAVSDEEYHERLGDIRSPVYSHSGG